MPRTGPRFPTTIQAGGFLVSFWLPCPTSEFQGCHCRHTAPERHWHPKGVCHPARKLVSRAGAAGPTPSLHPAWPSLNLAHLAHLAMPPRPLLSTWCHQLQLPGTDLRQQSLNLRCRGLLGRKTQLCYGCQRGTVFWRSQGRSRADCRSVAPWTFSSSFQGR